MAQIKGSSSIVAEVDGEHRLQVYATSQDLPQTLLFKGLLSSVFFQVTPVSSDDYFFYLKNTGTVDIGFNMVNISSTVPTKIMIESVIGTPVYVTGTDAEITNLNISNPLSPAIDAKFDTDITGLTKDGHLAFMESSIADTLFTNGVFGGIILPQGKAIAFKRVEATGALTVNLSIGVLSF